MTSIIICTTCKGEGEVREHTFRDWEYKECGNCKGAGRLRVLKYEVSVPYGYNDYIKADEKFIELLRGLEASSRLEVK